MKRLIFTVTNDLNYDQRMLRICTSLHNAGYHVTLVGRRLPHSAQLTQQPYNQKRLYCFFTKGKMFYAEYSLRLFLYLLFKKLHLICAIDLDTIVPCYFISKLRRKKRVYDAHELFCEMKEVVIRPGIYRFWKKVEQKMLPQFKWGYTVNEPIKKIFEQEYGVTYAVIRNMPFLKKETTNTTKERFVIYQGTVNHGRSFETLIPAFAFIDCPLWIYGDGNFYDEAIALTKKHGLQKKVLFKGKLLPHQLKEVTPKALLGVTLFENNGLNNYYSLGNRFFDYIHAAIPQVCVAYPAYKEINDRYGVAMLIDNLEPQTIASAINKILNDTELQKTLHQNCMAAAKELNWQEEEKKLIGFYNSLF